MIIKYGREPTVFVPVAATFPPGIFMLLYFLQIRRTIDCYGIRRPLVRDFFILFPSLVIMDCQYRPTHWMIGLVLIVL
jgi:hypothetical protein